MFFDDIHSSKIESRESNFLQTLQYLTVEEQLKSRESSARDLGLDLGLRATLSFSTKENIFFYNDIKL
jgi:hypothetical protein